MNRPSPLALRRLAEKLRPPLSLSRQIGLLRWLVPLLALALVIIHQTADHFFLRIPENINFAVEVALYGLGGPAIVWLSLGWVKRRVERKEAAEAELVEAHSELTHLNERISFLLRVNQRLGEAGDEESMAAIALRLPGEIVPAIAGAALVRFDNQHQPRPAEYDNRLDETAVAAWHAHIIGQSPQERCQTCQLRSAVISNQSCPLLNRLPLSNVGRVICQPLERNGHEFAMMGLFLRAGQTLNDSERDLLEAVIAEIAIALENARLRTRELATFYELKETLQLRLDFDRLMARILSQTMEASSANAGLMLLQDPDGSLTPQAAVGAWREAGPTPLVESLAIGAMREAQREPITASLQAGTDSVVSVLCAPMIVDEKPLGIIVLGSRRRDAFLLQQRRLVSAIAGQAALLAQNARLYAQLEHQAILAERGRLAREMHDGLAQTLGYLKMRAGQIARWIESGQHERGGSALRELAQTADDAYLDLRSALDGLLLMPNSRTDLAAQLQNCLTDFEAHSGVRAELAADALPPLSLPVQAHLLRIAQESLNNIRRHANAGRVCVKLTGQNDRIRLLIEDDGQGFDASGDLPAAHHGLRLMRERADLLGAELQLTSAPGRGTQVCVEWPVESGQ